MFIPDAKRSGLFRQAAAPQAEGETDPGQSQVALTPDALRSEAEGRHRQAVTPDALHSEAEGRHYQAVAMNSEAAAEEVIASVFGGAESRPASQEHLSSSDDSSTSSSSESSEPESENDWSEAFQDIVGPVVRKVSLAGPDFDFWRHKRTLTIHSVASGSVGEIFPCGRKRTADYLKVEQSAFAETRLCSNCRKSKPVRDIGALNAVLAKNAQR